MDPAGLARMEKIKEGASNMSGALAIFAKTKGLSPVKTRLAADIGTSAAEAFYTISVEATAEMAKVAEQQSHQELVPYWALAEKQALDYPDWQTFDRIWTGEGDLGRRLNHVYSRLRKKHDYVILIGTDSPQLQPDLIARAIEKLKAHPSDCVIGPALDGGFYLFAAKVPMAEQIWTKVRYSQTTTLEELRSNLRDHGIGIQSLCLQGDTDTVADFTPLLSALEKNNHPLPAQQKLYKWLRSQTDNLDIENLQHD